MAQVFSQRAVLLVKLGLIGVVVVVAAVLAAYRWRESMRRPRASAAAR